MLCVKLLDIDIAEADIVCYLFPINSSVGNYEVFLSFVFLLPLSYTNSHLMFQILICLKKMKPTEYHQQESGGFRTFFSISYLLRRYFFYEEGNEAFRIQQMIVKGFRNIKSMKSSRVKTEEVMAEIREEKKVETLQE